MVEKGKEKVENFLLYVIFECILEKIDKIFRQKRNGFDGFVNIIRIRFAWWLKSFISTLPLNYIFILNLIMPINKMVSQIQTYHIIWDHPPVGC